MPRFQAESSGLLASNMAQEAIDMETFPVLIGNEIAHFHRVGGGFNKTRRFDVVNFIHRVQGPGSPYRVDPDQASHNVEAHLSDNYYNLDVEGVRVVDEYPDRDYVLSMKVSDYQHGKFSFSEEMTADIDKRETRYES